MELESLNERLDRIEETLKFIQEKMVDMDIFLTDEERKMLDESVENEKSGKLVSSRKVREILLR